MAGDLIGYARVSTRDQDPGSQEAMLRDAGCRRVFVDHGESSRTTDRPQWRECLAFVQEGDTLVVRALDRMAGTTTIAIQTISELHDRGVNIKSLTEPDIDTTTPMGRALFGIVAVFAQLRVDTIRSNTRIGLEAARAQGRVGGRPTVMTPERIEQAHKMRATAHPLRPSREPWASGHRRYAEPSKRRVPDHEGRALAQVSVVCASCAQRHECRCRVTMSSGFGPGMTA